MRVFDLTKGCGFVMYGTVRKDRGTGRLIYRCGAYMKSQGQDCHLNTVDAEGLLQFTLRTIVTSVKLPAGPTSSAWQSRPKRGRLVEIQGQVEKLRRQVEQAPRRILEAEVQNALALLNQV